MLLVTVEGICIVVVDCGLRGSNLAGDIEKNCGIIQRFWGVKGSEFDYRNIVTSSRPRASIFLKRVESFGWRLLPLCWFRC